MKVSDPVKMNIFENDGEQPYDTFHKSNNDRKRDIYWIGFLDGTLSSKRIEEGEEKALLAEAENFARFFNDPDASDLVEDIKAKCFSSEEDLIDQLNQVITTKRKQLISVAPYSGKDEMNEFLGFCAGIICDGRILQSEAEAILGRFQRSYVLMNTAPFSQLRRAVESTMANLTLTATKSKEIQEWIAQLVGDGFIDTGLPNIGSVACLDNPIIDPMQIALKGSNFALTGPMMMGTRSFIISEIERTGGNYKEGITKITDYVVVSSSASRHWLTMQFGTKILRAQELINEGHNLRFVSEVALQRAIEMTD